jgi:NEDD4-binding protein 2
MQTNCAKPIEGQRRPSCITGKSVVCSAASLSLLFCRFFRNAELPSHTLDLHGQHVDEALEVVKAALEQSSQLQRPYMTIITGRGAHSRRGVARLTPAVMQFLQANHFRYSETQPGILRVNL